MSATSKFKKPKKYYIALKKAKEEELGLTHLYSHSFYKKGKYWVAIYKPNNKYRNEREIEDMIKQYAVFIQREFDGKILRYWVQSSSIG